MLRAAGGVEAAAGFFGADGQVEVFQAPSSPTCEHDLPGREAEGPGKQLRDRLVGGAIDRRGRDAHAQDARVIEASDAVVAGAGGDSNNDPAHGGSVQNDEQPSKGLRTGVLVA